MKTINCYGQHRLPLINPEVDSLGWSKQRLGLLTAGTYGMCVMLKSKQDHTTTSKFAIINKLVAERVNRDNDLDMDKYLWLNMIKPVAFNTLKKLFLTGLNIEVHSGAFVVSTDELGNSNGLAGTVDAFIPQEDAIAIFITPSSTDYLQVASSDLPELDVDIKARANFLIGITQTTSCYVVFVDPRFVQAPLVIKKITPEREEIEATLSNALKLVSKVKAQSTSIEVGIFQYNNDLTHILNLTDYQLESIYKEFNHEFDTTVKTKYYVD